MKQQGILSEFYKRLTGAFTRDSSDYLSTLSTAVDLLHFLVSVESYHDDEQPDAIRYRTQALTAGELRALIKWESDDQPLKQLEKILVVRLENMTKVVCCFSLNMFLFTTFSRH